MYRRCQVGRKAEAETAGSPETPRAPGESRHDPSFRSMVSWCSVPGPSEVFLGWSRCRWWWGPHELPLQTQLMYCILGAPSSRCIRSIRAILPHVFPPSSLLCFYHTVRSPKLGSHVYLDWIFTQCTSQSNWHVDVYGKYLSHERTLQPHTSVYHVAVNSTALRRLRMVFVPPLFHVWVFVSFLFLGRRYNTGYFKHNIFSCTINTDYSWNECTIIWHRFLWEEL